MMQCSLHIVRYPRGMGWAGFLSMAVFRFPLWLQRIPFWKLMGCGRNGTFDKTPDWRQWALLEVGNTGATPGFIQKWWKLFRCEIYTLQLQPIEGHGTWDGQACFGQLPKQTDYEGRIAVLTRATIRLSKLNRFWQHVPEVADRMATADGFLTSIGIGEVPFIKQATFSVWASKAQMKNYAYRMKEHAEVIRKTHSEQWYSEEMFVRFTILSSRGTIKGVNPLERIS